MDDARTDLSPRLIGWREIVAIPDWGIEAIEAKVDTGARSSAIDVFQVEELPEDRVRFHVALDRAGELLSPAVETAVSRRVRVRSSLGHAHDRLIVRAHIQVAGVDKEIEIGLVRRRRMLSRMLLGRLALEGDFLVDPGRRYLVVKPARRRRKRRRPDGEDQA